MDISKASNFERFIFDLSGRDAQAVRRLWAKVDAGGAFSLAGTPDWEKLPGFGFSSGRSTHADRIATIAEARKKYGIAIDPHTADAVKVAKEHPGAAPMVVLETAQAAKFAGTIREALGEVPPRPAELAGLEGLPQKVAVLPPEAEALKAFIAAHS
jgi:threonine synthase